jgi:hypothetical protein
MNQVIDKNKYALLIQRCYRGYFIRNKNYPIYLDLILNLMNKNKDIMNDLFIKCYKIYKTYPPAKNEYKFIFGGLIQMAFIDTLEKLIHKCSNLDDDHSYGSEYKNDCRCRLTKFIKFDISIKAKSKKNGGDIILISKFENNTKHNLENLITFVIVIEEKKIYLIYHTKEYDKFITNSSASIKYKSSLLTYMNNQNKFIYKLEENEKFKNFMNKEYKNIKSIDLYKVLYQQLI